MLKTLLKTFDSDMNKSVEEKEFEFYLQKTGKTKNKIVLKRQWRKFGTADFDGNRKLSITEFTAFLFPQFYEGTKDLLKNSQILKDKKTNLFEEFENFQPKRVCGFKTKSMTMILIKTAEFQRLNSQR